METEYFLVRVKKEVPIRLLCRKELPYPYESIRNLQWIPDKQRWDVLDSYSHPSEWKGISHYSKISEGEAIVLMFIPRIEMMV